ncbi:MAG: DUF655 domain-containing protein [Candidatus Methanomethylophilaceae archaeon]|nr:DUF655 domain-containing protein [Candidatus Methanomethylophilaceae archaeon]
MEEYAFILDYLAQGLPAGMHSRREPVCYAVGETEFKLFELEPKAGAIVNIGEKVYIGKDPDKRSIIAHVKRRIGFQELTNAAQSELEFVLIDIVKSDPQRFIRIFNEAQPINRKKHLLEELPGVGNKSAVAIFQERRNGVYKDFEDLTARVPSIKHPEKLISKRIELELADDNLKYRMFVAR